MEKQQIVMVDYDPRWPEKFQKHAALLSQALGAKALAIEHIGSTSVPGLAAKPIIAFHYCYRFQPENNQCPNTSSTVKRFASKNFAQSKLPISRRQPQAARRLEGDSPSMRFTSTSAKLVSETSARTLRTAIFNSVRRISCRKRRIKR